MVEVRTAFTQEVEVSLVGLFSRAFACFAELARLIPGDRATEVKCAPMQDKGPRHRRRGVRREE